MKIFAGRIQETGPMPLLRVLGVLVLLNSCNFFTPTVEQENEEVPEHDRTFYAFDYSKKQYYTVYALQLIENEQCIIYGDAAWAKNNTKSDEKTIREIADEYEKKIYPNVISVFGKPIDIDENEKLIILFLDIIDGIPKNSSSYMAGYFDSRNMLPISNSNRAEIIYLDIAQGKLGSETFNASIAHEFQHLLRYSAFMLKGVSTETWLDEGLSTAAEYVYLRKHLDESILHYNQDPNKTIARGNNFFYWEGTDSADYATAYLFFQWLRIHAASQEDPLGFNIYREICDSPHSGSQAVVDAAAKLISKDLDSWDTLIRTWLAANYMNAGKNASKSLRLYGYMEEFSPLKIHPYPKGETSTGLLPGEGVYSAIPKNGGFSISGSSGSHISYGDLRKGQPPIFNPGSKKYSGEYLLTYNGNNENRVNSISNLKEGGQVSGADVSIATPRSVSGTSAPLRIDGTSLLPQRP